MPRLTLKLSGAGRLLVAHRDVDGPVSQADLDALADEAARKHGGKRTATRLGADRRGDSAREVTVRLHAPNAVMTEAERDAQRERDET